MVEASPLDRLLSRLPINLNNVLILDKEFATEYQQLATKLNESEKIINESDFEMIEFPHGDVGRIGIFESECVDVITKDSMTSDEALLLIKKLSNTDTLRQKIEKIIDKWNERLDKIKDKRNELPQIEIGRIEGQISVLDDIVSLVESEKK